MEKLAGGIIYEENSGMAYVSYGLVEKWVELFRERDPQVRIQNQANLEGVLALVQVRYNDKKGRKEKVAHKAGYLLYNLAGKAHAFLNGNKRMAYLITSGFLAANGYLIPPGEPLPQADLELARFIVEIAAGKVSLNQTIKWMLKNMKEGGVG